MIIKRSHFLLIIFFVLFDQSCIYIPKALIFQRPGIENYKIFHNREVPALNYQPWNISKNYNKRQIPSNYVIDFENLETVAYLVIENDSIIFEKYWEGFNDSSISNSFSASKSNY